MGLADDNVVPILSTSERLVRRAMLAKEKYADAIANETKDRRHAIHAVIEYGEALLEGRHERPSNKAFAQWVSENGLDQGKPWNQRTDRTAAMALAKLVLEGIPTDAFNDCPNSRPNDIMRWYRKQHPDPDKKPRKAKKATSKVAEPITEDEALAEAKFTTKGRLKIEDAIRIHQKRLDKQFAQRVDEEVRRRINAADDAVRKQLAQIRQENIVLKQSIGRKGVFRQAEFRQLLMAVHPDNTASVEIRNRVLDILVKNEQRLITTE